MRIYSYQEYPDHEKLSQMTPEELKAYIKKLEEKSKNMTEWPKVE